MRPMIVTGASGQVGRALRAALSHSRLCVQREALFVSRRELDLSRPQTVRDFLDQVRPSLVINAAAYTAVDHAEKEWDLACAVNALSVGEMAHWCARENVPLVHYSTDYVFSGEGQRPWQEEDQPAPRNAYGRSKLAGEEAIVASGASHLILRTSWVYDARGANFFTTMLRLGAERDELRVVQDQVGAPTFAAHLARWTVAALERGGEMPRGIFHLCSSGETSWYEFAQAIFAQARQSALPLRVQQVKPISTAEYPTLAARPLNSRLRTERFAQVFGVTLESWQEGLRECWQEWSRLQKGRL